MKFAWAVLLSGLAVPAAAAQEQAVLVTVVPSDAEALAQVTAVVAERAGASGDRGRLQAGVVRGQATLALSPGNWSLWVEGAGLWQPVQSLVVEPARPGTTLEWQAPVWRTGTVAGQLSAASTEPLVLSFDRPTLGNQAHGARESVPCPVDAGRRFTCAVPQGLHNLQLRTPGFVPHYFWDVQVAPGATLDLPPVRLRTGASIAGFVGRPEGVTGAATVTLRTFDAEPIPSAPDTGQFSAPVTGRRGFFQLVGVPPGEYRLEAHLGELVSTAQQVIVEREAETWLREPLALSPPFTLDLVVDPPTAPSGGPWRVLLTHHDGSASTPVVGNVPVRADGTWRRGGLPAGSYRVGLSDDAGSRWALHDFELPADGPVTVSVSRRTIRGTVHLGRAPLAARLMFGRGGPVKVVLNSDENGEFAGHLPPNGGAPGDDWPVVVSSSNPPLRRTLGPVNIPPDGVLHLRLPDTAVKVRLVDTRGNLWNEKTILSATSDKDGRQQLLVLPSDPALLLADPDGEYNVFRGLSPGPAQLAAKSVNAASDDRLVEVSEGTPVTVELVMRDSVVVRGSVRSADGSPVAGALLMFTPAQAPFQGLEDARSSGDGTFELRVPPGTREIGLTVGAGGFAYKITRVAVRPGEDLTLVLSRAAGTLRLSLPGPGPFSFLAPGGRALFLFRGGHLTDLGLLRQWAEVNGAVNSDPRTLVVPHVEPGPYTLCLVQRDQVLPLLAGGPPSQSCAAGHLAAGTELELSLEHAAPAEK